MIELLFGLAAGLVAFVGGYHCAKGGDDNE